MKIDYEDMIESALSGVVKQTLEFINENGIIGDHHFYISFFTNHKKTEVPQFIKDAYPEEMTIVIQNQYEDLQCFNEHFEITLTFGGEKAKLCIPYDGIISFTDPSVDFSLQFTKKTIDLHDVSVSKESNDINSNKADNIINLNDYRK